MNKTTVNRPTVIPEPVQGGEHREICGFDWNELKGLYASGKAVPAGTTVITARVKP